MKSQLVDQVTMVCSLHDVLACQMCMIDDYYAWLDHRPAVISRIPRNPRIPRNLRPPTEGRCREWWREFVAMWRDIGQRVVHDALVGAAIVQALSEPRKVLLRRADVATWITELPDT